MDKTLARKLALVLLVKLALLLAILNAMWGENEAARAQARGTDP